MDKTNSNHLDICNLDGGPSLKTFKRGNKVNGRLKINIINKVFFRFQEKK